MKIIFKIIKCGYIISIIMLLVCVSGCKYAHEPQNRAYITGMLADWQEGRYIFYMELPEMEEDSAAITTKHPSVLKIEAESFREAHRYLQQKMDDIPDYSQLTVLVLKEALMDERYAYMQLMKELHCEKAIRQTLMMAIDTTKKGVLFEGDASMEGLMGLYIYEMAQNNCVNTGMKIALFDDFTGIRRQRICYLPVFELVEGYPEIKAFVRLPF